MWENTSQTRPMTMTLSLIHIFCFETVPAYYAAATERIRLARAAVEAGEKGV